MMTTAMMSAAVIPDLSPIGATSLAMLVGLDLAAVGVALLAVGIAVVARVRVRHPSRLGGIAVARA